MATVTVTPLDVQGVSLVGEFDNIPTSTIQEVIDEVSLEVNLDVCEEFTDPIVKYMTAHELVMRARRGRQPAGPVVSESAGNVSRSYLGTAMRNDTDAYFAQTFWGQKVLRYFRLIPASPLAVCTRGGANYLC